MRLNAFFFDCDNGNIIDLKDVWIKDTPSQKYEVKILQMTIPNEFYNSVAACFSKEVNLFTCKKEPIQSNSNNMVYVCSELKLSNININSNIIDCFTIEVKYLLRSYISYDDIDDLISILVNNPGHRYNTEYSRRIANHIFRKPPMIEPLKPDILTSNNLW